MKTNFFITQSDSTHFFIMQHKKVCWLYTYTPSKCGQ